MRYVCVRGHFYQPPRENPWLEAVEVQNTAYPYHDWNERITAECYAPNAATRVLDSGSQRITRIAKYRIYATDSVVPGSYREWRLEAEKGNPVAQGWLRVLTGVCERVGTKLA
jgi:hypothetical protein